eukprot:TRINITY_DN4349_c0_g1_i1.p1 TRINITY_DN4349_c0_g1~~TRINITY_DN4349_c0_g1_i1.p1  ORF type:complete len:362 (+),score=49.14 TRINITY_DN4349_c0_g1_i1:31-1116(+)
MGDVPDLHLAVEVVTYCLFALGCTTSLLPNPRNPTFLFVLVLTAVYACGITAVLAITFGLEYGTFYGNIKGVPIWVGMMYSAVLYATVSLGDKISKNSGVVAALSALVLFFLAFTIEPIAVKSGFWTWKVATQYYDVPLTVLFTWLVFGASYGLCFQFFKRVLAKMCQPNQLTLQILLPLASSLFSMGVLFVSWLGYAWICGIPGVVSFVDTSYAHPDKYFIYVIQIFCMAMFVGALLVVVIFFSRIFNTNSKLTIINILVALIPVSFHILFLAVIFVNKLSATFPVFLIASVCMSVLTVFFHTLPYAEHFRACVTGEVTSLEDPLPQKALLSSFEDIGMLTGDEVERMLLSPERSTRGDL